MKLNLFIVISKKSIKIIKSLHFKKYRDKHNLFLVEGEKCIDELIKSNYDIQSIYCTKKIIHKYSSYEINEISEDDLAKISSQVKPNNILAIVKTQYNKIKFFEGITLILDGINNPGNLGTIIRTCDWFGVKNIVCSNNTVDVYNPKVVQSTMGSIFRVNIFYTDLVRYLDKVEYPIYAATLDGVNLSRQKFPANLHLILGNESNGINDSLLELVDKKIKIEKQGKAESLNVSIASAVVLHKILFC